MSFSLHSGDARVCCEGGIIARTRYEIGNGTNMFFSLYSLKYYIRLLAWVINLLIRSAEQKKHLLCFCSN